MVLPASDSASANDLRGGERVQASARIVLALGLAVLCVVGAADHFLPAAAVAVALVYLAVATVVFGWVALHADATPAARRATAAVLDCAAAALLLGALAAGPFLLPVTLALIVVEHARSCGVAGVRAAGTAAALALPAAAFGYRWDSALLPGTLASVILIAGIAAGCAAIVRRLVASELQAQAARESMFSILSHDLRTPLNGVIGLSELLVRTPLTRAQLDLAQAVLHSGRTLLRLVEAVLDPARLDAGAATLARGEFEPVAAAAEVMALAQPEAMRRGIPLQLFIAADVPQRVRGDAVRWQRLLGLLLDRRLQQAAREVIVVKLTADRAGGTVACTLPGIAAAEARSTPHVAAGELARALGGRLSDESATVPLETLAPHSAPGLTALVCLVVAADPVYGEAVATRVRTTGAEARVRPTLTAGDAFIAADYDAILLCEVPLGHALECAPALLAGGHRPALLYCGTGLGEPAIDALAGAGFLSALPNPLDPLALTTVLRATQALMQSRQPDNARTNPSAPPGRCRVLVACAEPRRAARLRQSLGLAGHDIYAVQSGDEALRTLEIGGYDVALLDADLPVIGGLQVARLFRLMQPERRTVPVLLLTVTASPQLEADCREAGNVTAIVCDDDAGAVLEFVERYVPSGTAARGAARLAVVARAARAVVLDQRTLDGLMALNADPAFLRELIEGFVQDGRQSLVAIERALELHDTRALAEHAYALKGSARSIGALALDEACTRVGRLASGGTDHDEAHAALVRLFEATCSALLAYLEYRVPAQR